jgi:hypothetical protein
VIQRERNLIAIACAAMLGSCATPRTAPQPAPPAPAPRPPVRVVAPSPPVPDAAWIDAPLSPGDWRYEAGASPRALFGPPGQPSFTVRCQGRQIILARTGGTSATTLLLRASNGARSLPATAAAGATEATLPASDPFLDTMLFSRGRFAVEAPGLPRLIVPAWPEPARVVEDCRS